MSFPNMQLRALVESLVAYAMSKGWKASEVEATFDSLMEPMRRREKEAKLARMAEELTLSHAEDVLIRAMGEYWDSPKMDDFFGALKLRFPTRLKTLASIDDWAGEASNERSECGDSSDYEKLADKALNALRRLPWPKPVQVDQVPG